LADLFSGLQVVDFAVVVGFAGRVFRDWGLDMRVLGGKWQNKNCIGRKGNGMSLFLE
jgi:hypothetical protein